MLRVVKKSVEYNAIGVSFFKEIENLNAFPLRKMEEPYHFRSDSKIYDRGRSSFSRIGIGAMLIYPLCIDKRYGCEI